MNSVWIVYKEKEPTQHQIKWGGNTDPKGLLEVGKKYEVEGIEVHSWHTKVFLTDFPGKQFNSIWFDRD